MIQIKSNISRNLSKICSNHFDKLSPVVLGSLDHLLDRQRNFIKQQVRKILCGNPAELVEVSEAFIEHCTSPGKDSVDSLKVYHGLERSFNYTRFSRTRAKYYCAYDLASELKVNTCPYCNRNYTVTIVTKGDRIVRPDFDHFLPQKEYPLLALSFYNLVPSCSICNRTIKNQQKIVYGEYIHPYEEGFADALTINYHPKNVASAVGKKSDYAIVPVLNPLMPTKSKKCERNFQIFQLKHLYEHSHSGEIKELIRKHQISNGRYLEILQKAFPQLGTIDEVYQIAFGQYYHADDFESRPLAKMTNDIVRQLKFFFPGREPIQ